MLGESVSSSTSKYRTPLGKMPVEYFLGFTPTKGAQSLAKYVTLGSGEEALIKAFGLADIYARRKQGKASAAEIAHYDNVINTAKQNYQMHEIVASEVNHYIPGTISTLDDHLGVHVPADSVVGLVGVEKALGLEYKKVSPLFLPGLHNYLKLHHWDKLHPEERDLGIAHNSNYN